MNKFKWHLNILASLSLLLWLGTTAHANICVATGFICTGATPANSTICPGDDVGLSANTPKTLVAACTAVKCEYTCNAGWVKSGANCVPAGVDEGGPVDEVDEVDEAGVVDEVDEG